MDGRREGTAEGVGLGGAGRVRPLLESSMWSRAGSGMIEAAWSKLNLATSDDTILGTVKATSGTTGTTCSVKYWSRAAEHSMAASNSSAWQARIRSCTSGTTVTGYPRCWSVVAV